MAKAAFHFNYEVYDSLQELSTEDAALLELAREASNNAYAPYSKFKVGAMARLQNGTLVAGSNQENAAYPVGICAERVLLSAASSLHPGIPIQTMAISYQSALVASDHPISPCGICRQTLQEYEERFGMPVRLILAGMEGKIILIPQSGLLLPLSFTGKDLA